MNTTYENRWDGLEFLTLISTILAILEESYDIILFSTDNNE